MSEYPIQKLILKNFKSHSNTEIEYSLITSFIGQSQSGKSNIYRALEIILCNSDFPETWIKRGEKKASITIVLNDGTIITRERVKSGQKVFITTPCGSCSEYDGIQGAAPFIEKALGISPIVLDPTAKPEYINFMGVHDEPYLIKDSPAVVQRKISHVLGIDKLEVAKSKLDKKQKQLTVETNSLDETLVSINDVVSRSSIQFKNVNELLNKISNVYNDWKDLNDEVDKLHKIHSSYDSLINTTQKQSENMLKMMEKCSNKVELLDELLLEIQKMELYTNLVEQMHQDSEELKYCKADLKNLKDAFDSIKVCPTCGREM